MISARQASAAGVLVRLTVSLQCAGMGVLIAWARTSLASDFHRLGPFRSAVVMVRFITAILVLHLFEILLWAGSIAGVVFHSANLPCRPCSSMSLKVRETS
jgi:hypothetical protein